MKILMVNESCGLTSVYIFNGFGERGKVSFWGEKFEIIMGKFCELYEFS